MAGAARRVDNVMRFLNTVGARKPIIQGSLMHDATTPELVAAVSNYGAVGSMHCSLSSPDEIRSKISRVKALTPHRFIVGLYAPVKAKRTGIKASHRLLQPYRKALGLRTPRRVDVPDPEEQLRAVEEEGAGIVQFTVGCPSREAVARLHEQDTVVLGTATTEGEAVALEAVGVDAVVAQGHESGGLRATFNEEYPFYTSRVGSMVLIPSIVDAVSVPVVAAGGIMDGRGVVACFALGAVAVQISTGFLCVRESGLSDEAKNALIEASTGATSISSVHSGRPARLIENKLTRSLRAHEHELPHFPYQHAATSDLREAALAKNRADCQALWTGQGTGMIRRDSVHTKTARGLISLVGKESLQVMREIDEVYSSILRLRKYE